MLCGRVERSTAVLSRRAGYWTRGKRAVERAVQLPVRTLAAGHPAVHSLYEFAPQLGELLCGMLEALIGCCSMLHGASSLRAAGSADDVTMESGL